jgi:hypothetical protein
MKTLQDVENYIYELKTEIRRQDDYFLSNDFLLKTMFDPEHFEMLENELKFYERIERKLLTIPLPMYH